MFSLFNTGTPKIFADIDRVRAEMLGVTPEQVFETLEVYIGSTYVNDFNLLGRTFRVTAQADGPFRQDLRDIANLKTRNAQGDMVPLGSVATFRDITGPYRVPRYNLYPAAEVQGATLPGFSTGYAIAEMERLAAEILPDGFGFEWTELALQEKLAGNTGLLIFVASVVFVFLLLAAQYESWLLPLAVILIVPMCLLAAVSGLLLRGMDVNILAQIGFVVLVGLAAKNAILIVEFASQGEERGLDRFDAATEAARTRLRPILMTSFAFILGVVPLVIATGAGAEMRQSLGTAVFFGMLGVTFFGLLSRRCSTSPAAASACCAGPSTPSPRRRPRWRATRPEPLPGGSSARQGLVGAAPEGAEALDLDRGDGGREHAALGRVRGLDPTRQPGRKVGVAAAGGVHVLPRRDRGDLDGAALRRRSSSPVRLGDQHLAHPGAPDAFRRRRDPILAGEDQDLVLVRLERVQPLDVDVAAGWPRAVDLAVDHGADQALHVHPHEPARKEAARDHRGGEVAVGERAELPDAGVWRGAPQARSGAARASTRWRRASCSGGRGYCGTRADARWAG